MCDRKQAVLEFCAFGVIIVVFGILTGATLAVGGCHTPNGGPVGPSLPGGPTPISGLPSPVTGLSR